MDNLTHTLVGAALAKAGLEKRTALAGATLMIGANFPDIDVLFLLLPGSIDLRRGVTHGFPALILLPFVLAWLMSQYDQRVRRRRNPSATPTDFRQLVILSALSIWTHPTLDFMNVYGMRWLMPMVNKWFYADALFIVDLYIIAALGLGIWLSRRRQQTRPARVALAGLAAYVVAMIVVTAASRAAVKTAVSGASHFMTAPVPLNPLARALVIDVGDRYRFGSWSPGRGVELSWELPKGDQGETREEVALARTRPEAQAFLKWSRFPYYQVRREGGPGGRGGQTVVEMMDARYPNADWASARVTLP